MNFTLRYKADATKLIYESGLADQDDSLLRDSVRIQIDCDAIKTDFLVVSAIDNHFDDDIDDSINGIWLLNDDGENAFCIRPNGDIYDYVADMEGKNSSFCLN
ncbi:hypothetical protein [Vibrio sp. Hal054]|uniref:hypothetical protein n=1 Tax=Vibrio sp. Hal054 TaxID=3035158 RepID=UPI00301E5CE6